VTCECDNRGCTKGGSDARYRTDTHSTGFYCPLLGHSAAIEKSGSDRPKLQVRPVASPSLLPEFREMLEPAIAQGLKADF
jgi:hypothetical protein